MKKSNKVSDYKLNQLRKKYTLRQIIQLHILNKLTLSSNQLNQVIKEKNKVGWL